MRKILMFVLMIASTSTLMAQFPGGGGGRPGGGGAGASIGHFYGRIVDAKSSKGVDAASVQLIQSKFDTVTKTRKDVVVGGMLTKANGDFSIEGLPLFGNYRLKVTAIGYKEIEQKVAFEMKMGQGGDMSQAMAGVDKDLGNIKMEADAKLLENVTVTGSKSTLQLGIDRKVFNVEKNITSAGGTAVDVMRNVPSLNVDIDGNVTLRNSAPQIFVDGRPTTLTLEQIPADAIASVELITNPSAKYDASGGQSGILNVVLKKNRKTGYNGSVRAGIDSRARVNGGGDINIRQGKINVFANANYNQRKSIGWGETDRLNTFANPDTLQHQVNDNISRGSFGFGRFGFDYFVDNRNTITISQSIVRGKFGFDNMTNSTISQAGGGIAETQYRNTIGDNEFRNFGTQIGFKHLFAKPGKEWTIDANLNQSRNFNEQNIRSRSFFDVAQQNPKNLEFLQLIDGSGKNRNINAQTDFVNPINDKMKWEAGARVQMRTSESEQLIYNNGTYDPSVSNKFEYTDYVYAAYGTFSQKASKTFSYQLGLRAESSSYEGEQLGKGTYSQDFPISLFPSIFMTKTIAEKQDLQLNYTRRINRPNFFQLMPNLDISDTLNYQRGNPNLKPEFTNSLELSYMKTYGKNNNMFLATIFGKYTTNLISRYQSPELVGNKTAFVSTWINASEAYAAGVELVFRNNITKWWDMNFNTNVYYSKINGSNITNSLTNERVSSFSKMNNTFKVNKGWSIQLSGEYQSKSALPVSTSNSGGGGRGGFGGGGGGFMGGAPSTTQGYIAANYGVDFGIRKDFQIKSNTLTASLNWSDIFRTRRYFVHSEAVGFIQDDWRRRDPQIVRLNLSYRFGKFDISLFKRKNMRSGMEGMQDVQMQ